MIKILKSTLNDLKSQNGLKRTKSTNLIKLIKPWAWNQRVIDRLVAAARHSPEVVSRWMRTDESWWWEGLSLVDSVGLTIIIISKKRKKLWLTRSRFQELLKIQRSKAKVKDEEGLFRSYLMLFFEWFYPKISIRRSNHNWFFNN